MDSNLHPNFYFRNLSDLRDKLRKASDTGKSAQVNWDSKGAAETADAIDHLIKMAQEGELALTHLQKVSHKLIFPICTGS